MRSGIKITGFPAQWVVLFVGLFLTVTLAIYVSQSEERAGKLKYDVDTRQVIEQINTRLLRYENLLVQTRGFIDSHKDISRKQFKNYAESIDLSSRYPGIQGLGYTVKVLPHELKKHTEVVRASGIKDYKIWPSHKRSEYFSILFLEPMDWRNRRAIGFDMSTDPIRREAMARAQDTGKAALSGKVTLVQEIETDTQPGFLFYLPIYKSGAPLNTVEERRKALEAFVYSPFRSHDLFHAIFKDQSLGVDFEIFAGSKPHADALVYDRDGKPRSVSVNNTSRFSSEVKIELGGYPYLIRFTSLSSFKNNLAMFLPYVVALFGLIITALLWWVLVFHKKKAHEAELAKLQIIASERKFLALFQSAPLAVGLVNCADETFSDVNPEFESLTGYNRPQVLGKTNEQLNLTSETNLVAKLFSELEDKSKLASLEVKIKTKAGREIVTILSARKVEIQSESFVLFSLLDISEQKKAQEELLAERFKLEQIFNDSPAAMALWIGEDLVFEKVNPEFQKLFNHMDLLGKPLVQAVPELADQQFPDLIRDVLKTGKSFIGKEVLAQHRREPNGPVEDRYYDFSYVQIKNPDGSAYGVYDHAVDVTDKVMARRELEAKSAQLQAIIEQMPMAVVFADADGKLLFANKKIQSVWRHDFIPSDNVEGYREYVGFHPDGTRYEGKDWPLARAIENGETIINEDTDVLLGDGTRGILRLTAAPVRKQDGTIFGGIVLSQDVTDLKRSEEALKKANEDIKRSEKILKTITDNTASALFMMDGSGYPTFMNPAAEKLTGYKLDEIKDRPLHQTIRSDKSAGYFYPRSDKPFENSQAEFKPLQSQEDFFVGKSGNSFPVSYSIAPLERDGTIVGSVLEFRDITSQKETEQELRTAKDEAEHANELKSAFLANMSHEIRTPLGAMIGFADLLRDPSLTSEERASYIDVLTRNGDNLAVIINDILDLSKVEAGHLVLDFKEISPKTLAEEVVSLLKVKADEKDLPLEYVADPTTPEKIVADPVRLRQILINLVGNAIKFTKSGSVKMSSYGIKTSDNRITVCFEIADTGIGIEASQIENVFEMFVQGDGSMTRRFGGTGLGLALSRKLAQAMGGTVKIKETKVDVGSTFLVTVEDQPAKLSTSKLEQSFNLKRYEFDEQVLSGYNFLVVDDAPDNQQLIKRYLIRHGANVEIADNGSLGYQAALAGNFDMVLMDIQMPVMDGYMATQKLREVGYRKPIIALTAHAMSEVRKKALNVGFTDHLTKPINPDELLSAVVRHLKGEAQSFLEP